MTIKDNNYKGNTPKKRKHIKQISATAVFKVRTILNIIFIIGSVIGMFVYFFHSEVIGAIIILSSMIFKFAESLIRLLYR